MSVVKHRAFINTVQIVSLDLPLAVVFLTGFEHRATAATQMKATSSRSHCFFIIKMHQKDGTHTVLPCWAMLLIPVAQQIPVVKICAAESTQRLWRAATSHIDTWNIMKRQDDENASNNNFSKINLVDWCHVAKICQAPKVAMLSTSPGLGWQWTSFPNRGTGRAPDNVRDYGKRGETWGYQETNGEWRSYSQILDHWSYGMFMFKTAMDYQTLTSSDIYMLRCTNREHL